MANEEQLARLKRGVAEWNEWRKNNRARVIDLGGADLRGANLRGANLDGANLRGADLRGAYFTDKDLAQANYTGARFVDDELAFFVNQIDHDRIIRCIEFTPEYHQSGLAILSYFGQVLRAKYPKTKAKVTIEQDGLTVRMIIETPEGEREKIEETLTEYGLVVTDKMPPERLLTNDLQVIQLRCEIELAGFKLEQNRKFLAYQENRTRSLEEDKKQLYALIEKGISGQEDTHAIITQLLSHQGDIDTILQSLEKMAASPDNLQTDKVEKIIVELQQTNPTVFEKIHAKLLDYAGSGTAGNTVYAGLLKLIEALPKF